MSDQSHFVFATTFNRFQQSSIADQIRILPMPYVPPAKHTNWDEAKRALCIVKAAFQNRVLLLNSSSGRYQPDTIALAFLGMMPRKFRPKIALLGDMWQPNSGVRHWFDKLMVAFVDRAVDRYFVHSSEELLEFPRFWGLDKGKVRLCLYFCSVKPDDVSAPEPPPGDFIFAGGNSHRDYETLIEVARRMPACKFVFATWRLDGRTDLPPNVTAGQVPHSEFMRLMRASRAVVTPIKKGLRRSAGQQTYLNAMFFKKPAIVNLTNAARDHIRNCRDGLIVEGSPQSYVEALTWVLDPKNSQRVKQMCEAAHQSVVENYSLQCHLENAVKLMQEFATSDISDHTPSVIRQPA